MKRHFAYFFTLLFAAVFLGSASCDADRPDAPVVLKSSTGACIPTRDICGDGIDQDCNGDDTLCTGLDKDRDGFPAGSDCDDTDRKTYTGVMVPCSSACASGTRLCKPDGTFSDCSCSPLCEATGSGKCYYVSRLTGNDNNPGTFEQPWRSYLNFESYYSVQERPVRWVALQPGDVVYFMSGLYEDSINYVGTTKGLSLRGVRGTPQNRITFKVYPGHIATIYSQASYNFHILASSFIVVDGFEISNRGGDGIFLEESDNVELRNLHVHDVDGIDNNNISGVKFTATRDSRLHHSLLHDNYDRTNADTNGTRTSNSRNVVLFGGGNNRIDHNVIFQTPPVTDTRKGGACVTYKHSASIVGSTFEFDHNVLWNCFDNSIGTGSWNSYVHHNLIFDSDEIGVLDFGGPTQNSNVHIENNTIINSGGINYIPSSDYGPIGPLYFKNNIVVDNRPSYNATIGIVRIDPYGSESNFLQTTPHDKLILSTNCYFNKATTPRFNLYAVNDAARPSGGLFSLSEWQGRGYDQGSSVVDPRLNEAEIPQEAVCADKGNWAGW